jgi:hypothetical protein
MNLSLAENKGTVEVTDSSFGREYNEVWFIKSWWLLWLGLDKDRGLRRTVQE